MLKYINKKQLLGILANGHAAINDWEKEDFRENGQIVVKDRIFNEAIDLMNSPMSGVMQVIFENCVFEENVSIAQINMPGYTFKNNCRFNKNLDLSSSTNEFIFNIVTIQGTFKLYCFNAQKLEITEMTVAGETSISGNAHNLTIKSFHSPNKIELSGFSTHVSATIEDVGPKQLVLKDNAMPGLTLKNCTIEEIIFDKYAITNKLIISELKKVTKVSFINASYCRAIEWTNNEVGELEYNMARQVDLFIKEGTINKFELDIKQQLTLRILEAKFGILRFIGALDDDSSINVQSGTYNEISFKSFINKGHVVMANVELASTQTLEICASDMGKTDFIKCNFTEAMFAFENSKVSEIFLSQSDFGKTVLLNGKLSSAQAQLAFGQLTTAFQKQGDNVRALEYQAREVESHYDNIKWFFRVNLFKWRIWWLNLTKVNLWLNKWSNNFGRDWGRAFIFTVGLGFVIFYVLVITSDNYEFAWETHFKYFTPAFIKFMNPIRFIDTKEIYFDIGINMDWCVYILDLLGRIITAYGFYQLIAAFRKYGKKS